MPFSIKEMTAVAGRLKNSDPHLYEQFLRLFDQWTFDVTVAVTEAPSTDILQAQGRAQQMRLLMRTFSEALETNNATP